MDGGPVVAVCGLAFEAAIAAGPGVVTVCGPGSQTLAARLERLLAREARNCRGIISFGSAGGLAPELRAGDCVLAEAVVTASGRVAADPGWLRALALCLPDARCGTLAGVDQPLADAAAKARLHAACGACAVDMESHLAILAAQRHGLPFAACRVVLDPARRSVPSSALAGLRADGTTAPGRLLLTLAATPWQVPALITLAGQAGVARRSLRAARARLGVALAAPGT